MARQTVEGWLRRKADAIEASGWFRMLRVLEVAAILVALIAFFLELQQRGTDRAVRIAQLYNQIAEASRYNDDAGRAAVSQTVRVLAAEGVSLEGLPLKGANLRRVDLSSADLTGADLSYANLSYADLQDADLQGANLTGARLTLANMSRADLRGTNLTGADLIEAQLTGTDLSVACADPDDPPSLRHYLEWTDGLCPQDSSDLQLTNR